MLLVDFILKIKSKTYSIGFGLILAGAIGNFVDRIAFGYVRDFIMFDFWKTFPIFNFADCCIVIGCILVCVYFLFLSSDNKSEKVDKKVDSDGKN
jgi:signal peptidase II